MITSELLASLRSLLEQTRDHLVPGSEVSMEITPPTDRSKCDLVANAPFALGKAMGQAPVAVANILAEAVNTSDLARYFHGEGAHPGFLNIRVTDEFREAVLTDVLTDSESPFGHHTHLTGTTWVVEHTSPNPNKAMHVGHVRNNVIGMAVANLLEAGGALVIRDMVDNNRGIAITKAMWGFLSFQRKDENTPATIQHWIAHPEAWNTPADCGMKEDHFIGACYQLGHDASKEDPEADSAIRAMVRAWEERDEDVWALWTFIIDLAHRGQEVTLRRLGNHWDKRWHEHEHYEHGKELVDQGLKNGIFARLEDGAVLTRLEDYNLPDTIVLKSDGTSLYITQDIALTKKKKETYKADHLLWVIGPEQSMALKQVFAVCEQLGIGKLDQFTHLSYGLIRIKDKDGQAKKMSSRGDGVLLADDLMDSLREALLATGRTYDEHTLESLAIASLKYALLRAGRTSDMLLDLEHAVSMDGDSGLYLLYTLGRMHSLMEKQQETPPEMTPVFTDDERTLIAHLQYFPHSVGRAMEDAAPNLVIDYLLTLAQSFNSLYNKERFITDDLAATARKLALTKASAVIMERGLRLMGIPILYRV